MEVSAMTEITIYIDIYLFVNLFINGFLILITSFMLNRRLKFIRFFAADLAASVSGLMICFPEMNIFVSILCRVFAAFIISFSAFGYVRILKFLRNSFVFVSVTLTYTALIVGCGSLLRLRNILYINNNEVYYNLPVSFLLCMALALFIFQTVIKRIYERSQPKTLIYECSIRLDGRHAVTEALLDTGNMLKDAVSGLPVSVIDRQLACELIPEIELFMKMESTNIRTRIIPFRTADGKTGIMPAFIPDSFAINGTEAQTVIAVSGGDLRKNDEYGCILNPICVRQMR